MNNKSLTLFSKLGIGSGITVVGIFGGIWIAAGQIVDRKIECVASRIDSNNHIEIIEKIDSVKMRSKKTDSIVESMSFLLGAMATSSEILAAKNAENFARATIRE